MRLWDRDLERRLRQRIAAACGREALRKILGRWARNETWGLPRVFIFLLVYILPVVLVLGVRDQTGAEAAGSLLAVWWLGSMFIAAGIIGGYMLGQRADVLPEDNLPLSDEQVFDIQWRHFNRLMLDRVGGALLAGWTLLGANLSGEQMVALLLFALLHWLVAGAVMPALVSCLRARVLFWTGVAIVGSVVLSGLKRSFAGFEDVADVTLVWLPTGWAIQFLLWASEPIGNGFLALLPIAIVLILRKRILAGLRRRYCYREADASLKYGLAQFWELDSSTDCASAELSLREPINLERGLGLLDRILLRWLTPKEKLLLEGFGKLPIRFTQAWWMSWLVLAGFIGLSIWWGVPETGASFLGIMGVILVFWWTMTAEPLTSRATASSDLETGLGAIYLGAFPIDVLDLMRMSWKAVVIRTVAGFPQLVVMGAFVAGGYTGLGVLAGDGGWSREAVWFGAEMAVEFGAMALLAYPCVFCASCMLSLTGTGRNVGDAVVNILMAIVIVLGGGGVAAWVLISSDLRVSVGGMLILAFVMWVGFRYCWQAVVDGDIDLVRVARGNSTQRA